MYIIYKTTNSSNNKFYIGVHKQKIGIDAYDFDGYLGSGTTLLKAIKKYGKEAFSRETLYVFTGDEARNRAYKKESKIVTEDFISQNDNYNIKIGGHGGFDPAQLKKWATKGGTKALLTKKGIFAATPEQLAKWGSMSWKNRK
jgi:hypothetical protein